MNTGTIYDSYVEEMQNGGFIKKFSTVNENDIELSEDDTSIYITLERDCHALSIRGIRESKIKNKIVTRPYGIYIKIYDYKGEEAKPSDAVKFSIIELDRSYFNKPNIKYYTTYYHYPYSAVSSKKFLGVKKGIVITKDKKLEINIIRNVEHIKIGKLELLIECDKWYKS